MLAWRWCVLLLGAVFSQAGMAQLPSLPLFEQKIATAFSPLGNVPVSVSLNGSASWVAGSQKDSGTLQLGVQADGTTTETWSFTKISHSYTQNAVDLSGFNRSCVYTDASGGQRQVSGPNCWQGVPWFFPSFLLEPALNTILTVQDQTSAAETSKGLVKLIYTLAVPTLPGAQQSVLDSLAQVQKATAVTVYYEVQTALPTEFVYQQAFDNDESRSVEVAVQLSNYGLEAGFMIPHHIQRYIQRSLQVDLTVNSVIIR